MPASETVTRAAEPLTRARPGTRRGSREHALQALYQADISGPDGTASRAHLLPEDTPRDDDFARELVEGVQASVRFLDTSIQSVSREWRVARMAAIDRGILRLAAYEILYCADIPPRVSIDEAIELARAYGGADSSAFVNGLLDALVLRIAVLAAYPLTFVAR